MDINKIFFRCRKQPLKIKVFFLMSYFMTESETALICPNASNIKFIMQILENTMSSKNHFDKSSGYWTGEVLRAISQIISCSAEIAKFFVSQKFLESALKILTARDSYSPEERLFTLRALKSMAVYEECAFEMAKNSLLIDGI